jgi:hypothetical protein
MTLVQTTPSAVGREVQGVGVGPHDKVKKERTGPTTPSAVGREVQGVGVGPHDKVN